MFRVFGRSIFPQWAFGVLPPASFVMLSRRLAAIPRKIDYENYRDVDGVKTPFQWTIARPGGRFTIRIEQAQQNVPINENKFARPATATLEQKPPSQ